MTDPIKISTFNPAELRFVIGAAMATGSVRIDGNYIHGLTLRIQEPDDSETLLSLALPHAMYQLLRPMLDKHQEEYDRTVAEFRRKEASWSN